VAGAVSPRGRRCSVNQKVDGQDNQDQASRQERCVCVIIVHHAKLAAFA
jgi:hypothetical protein